MRAKESTRSGATARFVRRGIAPRRKSLFGITCADGGADDAELALDFVELGSDLRTAAGSVARPRVFTGFRGLIGGRGAVLLP